MQIINTSQGVGGILNSFKSLLNGVEKITFVGTPGFCTPFAELMGFVARDKKLIFIPNMDFEKARLISMTPEGMQLGEPIDAHADAVVLLGGLAMPKIGVSLTKLRRLQKRSLKVQINEKLSGGSVSSQCLCSRNGTRLSVLIISSMLTWQLRFLKAKNLTLEKAGDYQTE